MPRMLQTNPLKAIEDFQPTSSEVSLEVPTAICYGSASCGGFISCLMEKYVLSIASRNPRTQQQTDILSAHTQFFRPLFPSSGPVTMKLHEINIGKAWSTFRVEVYQGNDKIVIFTDIIISNLSFPGRTLKTGWELVSPPTPVDFEKLETDSDPNWISYHTPFYPDGFRRADSYAKTFISTKCPSKFNYIEQWITPGWDCTPLGSRDPSIEEARWTNELISLIADMNLPIQENFISPGPGEHKRVASVASTLGFAARQKIARENKVPNWRELGDDGSLPEDGSKFFKDTLVHATLSTMTDVKKKLPAHGTRWLFLRSETKSIRNGKMDMEVLIFDDTLDLVAINYQVAHIIGGVDKRQRMASL